MLGAARTRVSFCRSARWRTSLIAAGRKYDAVICGTLVVDFVVQPVELRTAIGEGRLFSTLPLAIHAGGLVANTGAAMARYGLRVGAVSAVGKDELGEILLGRLHALRIDTSNIRRCDHATTTSVVMVDRAGQRSFAHHAGAAAELQIDDVLVTPSLLTETRLFLVGYLSLLPRLAPHLPELLAAARRHGCRTAMESAGDGCDRMILQGCLPLVDVYFPSREEAISETGESTPEKMLEAYRDFGARGVIGIKLGADGAIVSEAAGRVTWIPPTLPPGKVVDTTGAGDAFLGAFLTARLRGMDCHAATRVAAAAGALCITELGPHAGLRDFEGTCRLAQIEPPLLRC